MDSIMNKCFKKNETIISRKIAGEMILVPICRNVGDMNNIFTLNKVGARVWENIDGKNSIGDIKQIVLMEYDENINKIEEDIILFIDQLKTIKAITEK